MNNVTPNIYQMLEAEETRLAENRTKQKMARAEVMSITMSAEQEHREYLNTSEATRAEFLLKDIETSKAAEGRIQTRVNRLTQIRDEEENLDSAMRGTPVPSNLPRDNRSDRTVSVTVGREARTYNPDTDPTGGLFVRDLIDDFTGRGRGESAKRIDRHVAETRVEHPGLMSRSSSGVGTGAFSGLVVPQYLTDLVAPAVANLRPFADNANKHPLPASGMSVNISRITTASSAALQTAELQAVSFTDMDDTLLTIPINTAAGQQLVSRQAMERGTGVEDTIVADLLRRVAVVVDNTMLNAATVGVTNTATTVTYTDATPTQEELFPFFYQAISTLEGTLRGVAIPNAIFMSPRRWNWYSSLLTANHPLVSNGSMPNNASGRVDNVDYGSGMCGRLPNGMPVYKDNNIVTNSGAGTNQDEIYVCAMDEIHLWEDAASPVILRAEQPSVASLGVNLVAYEYFAFTTQRYAGNPVKIAGTGLVANAGF